MLLVGGAGVLVCGCQAASRGVPLDVVAEVCQRSLDNDVDYVRGRISPALLPEASGEEGKEEREAFVRSFMRELQVCKPQRWEEGETPDKAVVELAGRKDARVRVFSVDMTYDKAHGWQLASRLYGERPLDSPEE
jgi:hypothetical protein